MELVVMKRRIINEEVPPEIDFTLVEEWISKESTPPFEKIKAINFMARKREEFDRLRRK
jgi:hypothetical protein